MTAPYLVVSADSHTGPRLRQDLRPYCESGHLEAFDRFTDEMEAFNRRQHSFGISLPESVQARRAVHSAAAGILDPAARLADMDNQGIAAEVIYHGAQNDQSIPFSSTGFISWSSPAYQDLEPIGIHLYNRWLADFVSATPDRLVGTAHIPITDVAPAVAEVEWAREAGFRAINLPAPRRDFPSYVDPVWNPFWAACADHDMVLNTHGGAGEIFDYGGGPVGFALYMAENPFMTRRALAQLIFSGVFERHPNLKLVLTEQFGDWLTETLADLQSAYYSPLNPGIRTVLPKEPIEYWAANCFVGASFMARHEATMAIDLGWEDRFLWGSDYPHHEGTWPDTRASLQATFHDLPPAVVAKILGENAIAVYGLDGTALAEVAARIGPTPADFSRAPEAVPENGSLGFRRRGKWS